MALRGDYLILDEDEPLAAVLVEENGRQRTYYFSTETAMDDVLPPTVHDALSLAGVWADLDWDEMVDALDEIRHANPPSPPVDDHEDL